MDENKKNILTVNGTRLLNEWELLSRSHLKTIQSTKFSIQPSKIFNSPSSNKFIYNITFNSHKTYTTYEIIALIRKKNPFPLLIMQQLPLIN